MTSCYTAFWFAAVAGLGTVSTVTAAPQTFNTALPVAKGEFVLREQFVYRKATADPAPTDRELRVAGGISVLGYTFVAAWGKPGSGPGQFHDPTGVAVAHGEVFVADSRNGRIQVLDVDGVFQREFAGPGEALGKLGRPMNLTIHDNELYVAEYFNDRIQVFSLEGAPQRTIGAPGTGPGQFNAPGGTAVGSIYVADFYNQRVQLFGQDGRFVRQWGTTGNVGISAGQFNYPTDVALAPGGILYVADGYNDRIQVFDARGESIRKWGGPFAMNIFGPFHGWFATVTGIAFGPHGNLFAADFYNDRVQKFAPDGSFLTAYGVTGSGRGQFSHPMSVAVARDGTVFVTDFLNNRVQKWQRPR